MSTEKKQRTYKPQKTNYVNLFKTACADFKKILLISADNVGSSQMAQVRLDIRKLNATLLMGKNTLMKTAIKQAMKKNPKLKVLLPMIKGNCGLVFTNGNLAELKKVVTGNRKEAPAKTGSVAMTNVTIPAQNTGCEPTKTQFFQALDIPTKITKGTVEIVSDFAILKIGDQVSASQAELLSLLKIYPFSYGLECYNVYDDGEVYDPEVLDLTDDDLMNAFYDSTSQLAALSLELDMVNEATVPHSLANAFKDLLSIAVETDYSFKQAETIKEFLKDPSKFAKASTTTVEKKEEKKEEEEEEEEEEANAGGLFDEEDEDEDDDDDSDSD